MHAAMKKRIFVVAAVAYTAIVIGIALSRLGNFGIPVYRVMLDPGHGGFRLSETDTHGDRYDRLSGEYLEHYREGAAEGNLEEHAIVYAVAEKVRDLLALCGPHGDFSSFRAILARYTDAETPRIIIETGMSRPDSRNRDELRKLPDPNAAFREFDYPAPDGSTRPGRISRINQFKPHLVVSLHTDRYGGQFYMGMNPVIVPPPSFLRQGLAVLKGEQKSNKFFVNSKYKDWLVESAGRTGYEWFLSDTSLYYTCFPLKADKSVNKEAFRGYRYNMVTWAYADDEGWVETAKKHPANTRYADTLEKFVPEGKFWEREQSRFEDYRRDDGEEGHGGDNHFASAEIIRYMMYALRAGKIEHPDQKPGRPFYSVWQLPLSVNAISAYIELGYLLSPHYRMLFTEKVDVLAEGIAVGIYSLFAGLTPRPQEGVMPRGKSIDLKKYSISKYSSYFDIVAP